MIPTQRIWRVFTNSVTIATISLGLSYALVMTFNKGGPVLVTSDFQLHTPRVPVGGVLSYSLWRTSYESCPGTVVTTFMRKEHKTTLRHPEEAVFIMRRPLSTPGYNSPPRLNINVQLPDTLIPTKWHVRVGIESECPARKRFDITAEFDIEVINGPAKDDG